MRVRFEKLARFAKPGRESHLVDLMVDYELGDVVAADSGDSLCVVSEVVEQPHGRPPRRAITRSRWHTTNSCGPMVDVVT